MSSLRTEQPDSQATVPDSPRWGHNPRGNDDNFARLIPRSPLARREFALLAEKLDEDPQWMPHARRFV